MTLKKILLIVGVAVIVVLVGLAGFLLFRGYNAFREANNKLRDSVTSLKSFYARDPFPSEENVSREEGNVRTLQQWRGNLLAAFRKGQIEPSPLTPARFVTVYSDTRNRIAALADRAGTSLPGGFAFAFERLAETGELPSPSDVPRLTQQLRIIEQVCMMLFSEGVPEILSVTRDVFEADAAESGGPAPVRRIGRRGATRSRPQRTGRNPNADVGLLQEGDLQTSLGFEVELRIRESQLERLLNRLAAHDMYAVVKTLALSKSEDDIRTPPAPGGAGGATDPMGMADGAGTAAEAEAAPAAPARPLSRDQRLVSGPELEQPMKVILQIDVYRFAEGE